MQNSGFPKMHHYVGFWQIRSQFWSLTYTIYNDDTCTSYSTLNGDTQDGDIPYCFIPIVCMCYFKTTIVSV